MHDVITHSRIMMNRAWAMPSPSTFTIKPIRQLVKRYLNESEVSIDPFARNCGWATHTNDLSPDTSAEYHLDAGEFLRLLVKHGVTADLVLFDPPYSLEQCKRSYENVRRMVTMRDTQIWGRWTEHKELITKLVLPRGFVLSFGFNSNGIGIKYGFEIVEILIVAHGGGHNDTICTVEQKVANNQTGLFEG